MDADARRALRNGLDGLSEDELRDLSRRASETWAAKVAARLAATIAEQKLQTEQAARARWDLMVRNAQQAQRPAAAPARAPKPQPAAKRPRYECMNCDAETGREDVLFCRKCEPGPPSLPITQGANRGRHAKEHEPSPWDENVVRELEGE